MKSAETEKNVTRKLFHLNKGFERTILPFDCVSIIVVTQAYESITNTGQSLWYSDPDALDLSVDYYLGHVHWLATRW